MHRQRLIELSAELMSIAAEMEKETKTLQEKIDRRRKLRGRLALVRPIDSDHLLNGSNESPSLGGCETADEAE